jgi:hypothetical protein
MSGLLLSPVEASVLLPDVISRCASSSASPTITNLGFTIVRVRVVGVAGELYSLTVLERGARCRKLGGRGALRGGVAGGGDAASRGLTVWQSVGQGPNMGWSVSFL